MNVNDLEKKFNEIQRLYESGQLSKKEYATLINGLNLESAISNNAKDLQKKQDLYDAMIKAAKVAKAIL
jgi:uncharacterized protein YqgQ